MKKISILAIVLAILLTLSTVAMAEENALTLSDASAREDETIYLTLRLNKSVIGDAVGISYSFDSSVLEPVVSSCAWSQKGTLSNFNKEHAGVWAASAAKDLAGDICVLAFRVKDGAKLTETTVSCTLVIKNGSVEQGTFTAQAKITYACDHSYGDWESGNESGHVKSCTHCGSTAYQPHSWNAPETEENTEDPDHDWLVYTCQICGFVEREAIPKVEKPTVPTAATEPVTEPTATVTVPSMPTMPQETEPIPTPPPASVPTVPTAPNPGDPDGNEPVKQTDPTLPPQETLPREPETQPTVPSQETRPVPSEGDPDKDSASGENDEPTEKDDETDPVPETSRPTEDPKDPSENTESTVPGQPDDGETEPATDPKDDETKPTTRPTYPDNSSNVRPQTEPTVETEVPETTTVPTTPYNDYNSEPPQTTRPMVIPVQTQAPARDTAPSDTHDHGHESVTRPVVTEEQGNPVVNALMITGVLIAAAGGAILYLKKKRK